MELAITVTDAARLAGLSRALAVYNERNAPLSEQEFVQKLVNGQLDALVKAYVVTTISKLAFLNRFTAEERIAIRAAAQASPAIDDYLHMLSQSDEVDLTYPLTVSGVQSLETVELIGAGRAAEILAL